MNILIIEDDAAIRQELKLLLENALYQVTVLTEFHHVVEDILQIEPDLLLLDVNLPQQSGFEICKSIRKTSDVPIIFLTSRTDSMDELSGMLQGGDAYITKPFQPPLLLAHIAAVLKRAKKADVPHVRLKLSTGKASLIKKIRTIDKLSLTSHKAAAPHAIQSPKLQIFDQAAAPVCQRDCMHFAGRLRGCKSKQNRRDLGD